MNNYNNYMTMQDLQGIAPVMQNLQGQQQSAQQALSQGGQLAAQALGTPQQIQMANALRQGNANQPKETKLKLEQLYEIALRMFASNSIVPDDKAKDHLRAFMEFMYKTRNQYFGNARNARKLVEESIKNQHLRLAKLEPELRTIDMIQQLCFEDVEEFKIDYNAVPEKRTIGFKNNA
jgi:hypothetical protein